MEEFQMVDAAMREPTDRLVRGTSKLAEEDDCNVQTSNSVGVVIKKLCSI